MLSVTEKGFGVRSSAYDYRITGRGGQGINNMDLSRRSDAVVAVFPVGHNDQIMLVTDGGMVIRCPVDDIRIARRRSQGVVIFKVGDGERVVSVARLPEESDENGDAPKSPMTRRTTSKPMRGTHERAAHRDLSRHLRPDHQRPYRHHPPRGPDRRPAGHRRRPQRRQGPALRHRRAGRDRARRDRPSRERRRRAHRGARLRDAADELRRVGRGQGRSSAGCARSPISNTNSRWPA